MIVTGYYNKVHGYYRMNSPTFPYDTTTYIGYSFKEMKQKYRKDHNLRYKHIEWIIV